MDCLSSDGSFASVLWETVEDPGAWATGLKRGAKVTVVRTVHGMTDTGWKQAKQEMQHILLVSARTQDTGDLLPDLVTEPIVQLASSVLEKRRPVLHFLRPATWESLCSMLEEEHDPRFFHVVHFDIHGFYDKSTSK